VIEKVFGKRKHRLIFVYVEDHNVYSSDECAEWMRAFHDTLDSKARPESYENPHISEMFERIKEDNITPEERAKMKDEENREEGEKEARQEGFEEGERKGLKEGERKGLEKGEKKGLEKGEKKKAEETARNLLALGSLSAEEIASVTGLTLERVKALSAS